MGGSVTTGSNPEPEPEPYPIFSFLRLGTSSLATALVAKTVAAKAILKCIISDYDTSVGLEDEVSGINGLSIL